MIKTGGKIEEIGKATIVTNIVRRGPSRVTTPHLQLDTVDRDRFRESVGRSYVSIRTLSCVTAMAHFEIEQEKREVLTAERAAELLSGLGDGVESVKLSGKSFGDGSAAVAAAALQGAVATLRRLDLSDIIASRPEEEAKRALATIADGLASCKRLTHIDLSDNALGAKGIRAVGGLLAGQADLRELRLCNNGLAADAGKLITASLLETAPTELVTLHFHNNLLETAGSVALAPVVESSPKLADFRFSSLRLGREGAVRICRALEPRIASTLVRLNLSDNTFGEEGAEALAEALGEAPLLESVLLRDSGLGDDGVKVVCEALASNAPKLTVLDVSGNEMASGGAKGLAKLLAVGKVKEVRAEDNELGSGGAVRIAGAITASAALEVLDVKGSEIGGRGASALAKACSHAASIKEVALNGNCIPEEVVSTIEDLLGEKLGSLSDNDEEGDEDEDDDEEDEGEEEEEDEGQQEAKGIEPKAKEDKAGERVDDADVDDLAGKVGKLSV